MFIKILDNDGNEIGCIDRAYLVPLGLRHQIVRVIVWVPHTSEVLLQQRSLLKDSCPGMWDTSASGHVDAHEDSETAALRELKEEIGIIIPNDQLKFVGSFQTTEKLENGMLVRDTLIYCLELYNKPRHIKIDSSELEGIKWIRFHDTVKPDNGLEITPGAMKALSIFAGWMSKEPIR